MVVDKLLNVEQFVFIENSFKLKLKIIGENLGVLLIF
jgi:predicted aspartyl protease